MSYESDVPMESRKGFRVLVAMRNDCLPDFDVVRVHRWNVLSSNNYKHSTNLYRFVVDGSK